MIVLLLCVVCVVTLDVDVSHCDGAADAQELRRYANNYDSLPMPKTRIRWSQLDTIEFSLALPFVAAPFRYILSFDPIEQDAESSIPQLRHPTRCSSLFGATLATASSAESDKEFDTSDDNQLFDSWTFAPNANFPRAFSSADKYSANHVSNRSVWRAVPVDCAHVRYTATLKLDDLAQCHNSLTTLLLNDGTTHATLASLFVAGVAEHSRHIFYQHRYNIVLYTDTQGNAAMLFDSATDFDVVVRSISSEEGSLSLKLQTISSAHELPLELSSINARQPFDATNGGDFAEPVQLHVRSKTSDPYGDSSAAFQNWEFSSDTTTSNYNGQYALVFTRGDTAELVDLLVRIDDAPAVTDAQLTAAHGAIAQHKPDDPTIHKGNFKHGERVCMQSFILLPDDISQHTEVELLEAALCPDVPADGTAAAAATTTTTVATTSSEFLCRNHTHGVVLFANGKPARPDVSLVWPGAYGPSSVALCFNASATVVDAQRRTVVNSEQRYEARVALHAHNAAAKQASVAWHANRREAAERAVGVTPRHLQKRAVLVRSQFSFSSDAASGGAFASGDLERSFEVARNAGVLDKHELQVYRFFVERSETLVHGVTDSEAVITITVIVAIVVLVVMCYVCFAYRRQREIEKRGVSTIDRIASHWQK